MTTTVERLRKLLDKLTEERDELASVIETAQSQIDSINDAVDAITSRVEKLESIAEYELQDASKRSTALRPKLPLSNHHASAVRRVAGRPLSTTERTYYYDEA